MRTLRSHASAEVVRCPRPCGDTLKTVRRKGMRIEGVCGLTPLSSCVGGAVRWSSRAWMREHDMAGACGEGATYPSGAHAR